MRGLGDSLPLLLALGALASLAGLAGSLGTYNNQAQCKYPKAYMVAFKMQMIGYTKASYHKTDENRLTRAVADTLEVPEACAAIAFVTDEAKANPKAEASIMVGVTVLASSRSKEMLIRKKFTEPTIQQEFSDNLKKEGVDPSRVEESVGGKFVRVGGHALYIGLKIAIVGGVLLFLIGAFKLYQLRSSGGGYEAISSS